MKVLLENDSFVLGQEADQMRALGVMLMISGLAPAYAKEPLFTIMERYQAAIRTGTYGLLYERSGPGGSAEVPVALVTWAFLSRACGVTFAERMRPLYPTELRSGNKLWVIDIVSPFSHAKEVKALFEEIHKDYADYAYTKMRSGKWRTEVVKNAFAAGQAKQEV